MAKKIDPCTLVLFGASGNLSRVKLMPGLFRLDAAGRLPDHMAILSVGRGAISRDAWQADIKSIFRCQI
jgi:glucose-6-phosphate 1-dehydrogenase